MFNLNDFDWDFVEHGDRARTYQWYDRSAHYVGDDGQIFLTGVDVSVAVDDKGTARHLVTLIQHQREITGGKPVDTLSVAQSSTPDGRAVLDDLFGDSWCEFTEQVAAELREPARIINLFDEDSSDLI